ncbi:hypothetical protein APHAL10511_008272 [Amanita phalloides]|nr:hypothetical protein APHAL10511_008272 [Amanita phalloides]
MNGWPVELISYVFGLACADDGNTVRALSLTSKQCREIARPFLFQSLVITTTAQLITLSERLRETPAHLRRIRYLFLSINHEHAIDRCEAIVPLIINALQLVAGSLRTLTLVVPCPLTGTAVLSCLFRIPFPHLEELTVAGLYAFSFQTGNFPRLRRLHFAAGNKNPHGLFQFGALDRAFPELTSLRVSGLSKAVSFVDELGRALEDAQRTPDEASLPERISPLADVASRLPPHLETIYVQHASPSPSPAPSRAPSRSPSAANLSQALVVPSGSTNDRHKIMIERLADLGAKYDTRSENRAAVQLVVLDGAVAAAPKQDWLDRLDGKEGAWISYKT